MSNVSIANIAPNPELTQVAVDYDKTIQGFVSDQIAPVTPVTLDLFKYGKWGRESLKDIDRTSRAIGSPANNASKLTVSYIQDQVERFALKDSIPDEILSNSPTPTLYKSKRVQSIVRKLKLGVEQKVRTLLDAGSGTAVSSGAWDVAATTSIEKDIDIAKEAMRKALGVGPTHMVINKPTANAIRQNATIRELVKYTGGLEWLRTGELPSELFGLQVIVPGAQSDTAAPGAASAAIADVWSAKTAYFLFVDPESGSDTVTALMQFRNTVSQQAFAVKEWRDPDQSANLNWFSSEVCQKVINVTPEAIYNITGVQT